MHLDSDFGYAGSVFSHAVCRHFENHTFLGFSEGGNAVDAIFKVFIVDNLQSIVTVITNQRLSIEGIYK